MKTKRRLNDWDARVAEAMADGDTVRSIGGKAYAIPATPTAIAIKLGMAPTHVRSVQSRIRRQLGKQAI